MGARHLPAHTRAGFAGMLLIAALYVAHALLLRSGGRGLGGGWLLCLLLPGALAAHLSWSRGMQSASASTTEGALSGLVMAHFAAVLQVCVLSLAVLNVDWARYAQQVGPEIATGVRDAAIPAAIVGAVVAVIVAYAGCILAGWLGSVLYSGVRTALTRK